MIKKQDYDAVANFIIKIAKQKGQKITNMQLQKILFFLQGYCLARYGKPLIDASFAKWQYGPAIKPLYKNINTTYLSGPIESEISDGYFDDNGKLHIVRYQIKGLTDIEKAALISFINHLLDMPIWRLKDIICSDPSYTKFKNKIMDYKADDYTNREIKKCYLNSRLKLRMKES